MSSRVLGELFVAIQAFIREEEVVRVLCATRATCKASQDPRMVRRLTWIGSPANSQRLLEWLCKRALSFSLVLPSYMPDALEFTHIMAYEQLEELECLGTLLSDAEIANALCRKHHSLYRLCLSHCSTEVGIDSVYAIARLCPKLTHLRLSHPEVEGDQATLRNAAAHASHNGRVLLLEASKKPEGCEDYYIVHSRSHCPAPPPPASKPTAWGIEHLQMSASHCPATIEKECVCLRLLSRDDVCVEVSQAPAALAGLATLMPAAEVLMQLRGLYEKAAFELLHIRTGV